MGQSLDELLRMQTRKLVVASQEVSLFQGLPNEIFVLTIEESRGSAGGRAAGSGHRRINSIVGFSFDKDGSTKFFETDSQDIIDSFEIPYSAVAMDIRLSDNTPMVVQGVIDPELVKAYKSIISSL